MAPAKDKPAENVDEAPEVASFDSPWEFLDAPATVEQVTALLRSLEVPYSATPGVLGDDGKRHDALAAVTMEKYLPFVLPMTNNKKTKDERGATKYVTSTTLYTQVAGRLALLNDTAARNGWAVDIYPEATVPTGVPGYLRMDDVLLFRVYVEIAANGRSLGRKFGTASGKATGGNNAEGTNPYETVETSALGRALAQWGFGILPGSGIASVEEMRLAQQNGRAAARAGSRGGHPPEAPPAESRGDLIASALDFTGRLRSLRGFSEEQSDAALERWINEKFAIVGFVSAPGTYEWQMLSDAQIKYLRGAMRDAVQRAAAAAGEGQG